MLVFSAPHILRIVPSNVKFIPTVCIICLVATALLARVVRCSLSEVRDFVRDSTWFLFLLFCVSLASLGFGLFPCLQWSAHLVVATFSIGFAFTLSCNTTVYIEIWIPALLWWTIWMSVQIAIFMTLSYLTTHHLGDPEAFHLYAQELADLSVLTS